MNESEFHTWTTVTSYYGNIEVCDLIKLTLLQYCCKIFSTTYIQVSENHSTNCKEGKKNS